MLLFEGPLLRCDPLLRRDPLVRCEPLLLRRVPELEWLLPFPFSFEPANPAGAAPSISDMTSMPERVVFMP